MSGWWLASMILFMLILLAVIVLTTIALYVGWKLMHPPRKPISMKPEEFGIHTYKEVIFPSRDPDIRLSGWYMSATQNGIASNGITMIFSHGYSQNRLEPHLPALSLAKRLLAEGYDILMYDFRNSGLSEGKMTTVGYLEQRDLLGAIDFVSETYPSQQIALIGFSMGAVTSLLAAGEDERVQFVVADSPYYALDEYLHENLSKWTGLPRFPFNQLMISVLPFLVKAQPRHVAPYRAVQKMGNRPILLIHGTGDQTIPHDHSRKLVAESRHPLTDLWLVPEAGHVRSYAKEPDAYVEKVLAFLQQAAKNPLQHR